MFWSVDMCPGLAPRVAISLIAPHIHGLMGNGGELLLHYQNSQCFLKGYEPPAFSVFIIAVGKSEHTSRVFLI
jgi:hypothetical protein